MSPSEFTKGSARHDDLQGRRAAQGNVEEDGFSVLQRRREREGVIADGHVAAAGDGHVGVGVAHGDAEQALLRGKIGIIARRAEMAAIVHADFNLGKVRKNMGDQLSGGERRRTEIARCLAIDPKFIMLDEPFAGVDPIAVEEIQHVVWRLKYRNIGILITDHNVQETLTITDRAYLLFEGRILFQGKPEELAQNRIVREKYLGSQFELKMKDFQLVDEQKRKRDRERELQG